MDECYRVIKRVDIEAVSQEIGRLTFISVNQNSREKCACRALLEAHFTPVIREFIAGLNLGGRQARAVFRLLPKKQGIDPHKDEWMPQELDWRRFQLPIITHPEIIMRWPDDGVEAHLEPGVLYEVNYSRTHEVINPQDEIERIHLQIDQIDATI